MVMAAGCVFEVVITNVHRRLGQIVGPLPLLELDAVEVVGFGRCLDLLLDADNPHQVLEIIFASGPNLHLVLAAILILYRREKPVSAHYPHKHPPFNVSFVVK